MSESTDQIAKTVDPAHLANMRDRLKQYRQRHAAVLKKERERERIVQAEAETRKRLQELLEAEQAQKKLQQNPPDPTSSIPQHFLSNAFAMVSEKDAINWLKANPNPSSNNSPSSSS
ncbi:hypothetical protein BDA99DRAFT_557596 [Phascolomyces articulosus]|uniref:Uncharacterized protein n=1 Tax=Phascolomyces articulosus TaxID=60185 RepID=A0AAD5KHN5_9FUNG|nr:hypothetical protein BDA99DRAFT_557596 [Phascolomyces articulosus]